ncbi:hypothetical protein IWQ61_008871 [Dispira simplex]|nr:hypothetical protein IWQ61_008871 [Dispira simplex]
MTPLTTYVPAKPTSLTTGPTVPSMEDSTDYRPPLFLPEPLDSGHDTISTDWSDSLFSTVNATRNLYPDTLPSGSAVTTTTPLGNAPLIHQASFHTTASSVSTTTPALTNPSTATILSHYSHNSRTPIDYELFALGKTSSLIRPSLNPTSAAQSAHQRYL